MEDTSVFREWVEDLQKDSRKNKALLAGVAVIGLFLLDLLLAEFQVAITAKYPILNPILNQFQNIVPELLTVLLIGLFTYWLLSGTQRIEREQQILSLASVLSDHVKATMNYDKNLEEMGVAGVDKNLDYGKMCDLLANSNNRVWILHTWTRNAYVNAELRSSYISASENHADIRILLLNPKSIFATQRSEDSFSLHDNDSMELETPKRILDSLSGFQFLLDRTDLSDLSVRFYDALPSAPVYIFDEIALMGFFFHGKISGDTPILTINLIDKNKNATVMGNQLIQEFVTLWEAGNDALVT